MVANRLSRDCAMLRTLAVGASTYGEEGGGVPFASGMKRLVKLLGG